jgi:2,3-dihydroxyphenylpropionate 1,2-dioxygenase
VRTWLAATAAGGGHGVRPLAYEPVEKWITGMGVSLSPAA